jgi:hypothetical protein
MSITIRRICPRNVQLSKNWGVCGYDIFVHPDHCKLLFQSLIIHGGACPIGISEETYLALECDPPLLIFPRDYPDTVEGMRYWNVNTTSEWNDMRHYWEGGGGRIATIRKETTSATTVHEQQHNDSDNNNHRRLHINWSGLVDGNLWNLTDSLLHRNNASTTNKNQPSSSTKTATGDCVHGVVVIRSREYIEPFQMALLECTSPKNICPTTATTLTSIPTMNCTNNFICTNKVPLRKRNHRSRTNTSTTNTRRRRCITISIWLRHHGYQYPNEWQHIDPLVPYGTAPWNHRRSRRKTNGGTGHDPFLSVPYKSLVRVHGQPDVVSIILPKVRIIVLYVLRMWTMVVVVIIRIRIRTPFVKMMMIRMTLYYWAMSPRVHFLYLVVTVTVLPLLVPDYGYKQFPIHYCVWGTTPPPPPPLYRHHHHPTQSYWLQLLLLLQLPPPPKRYNSKCMSRIRIVRHGSTLRHCRSIIISIHHDRTTHYGQVTTTAPLAHPLPQ